jgi:hypothetical protein
MPSLNSLLRSLATLSSLKGTAAAIGIAFAIGYFAYFVCSALDRNPDLSAASKADIARFLKTAHFRHETGLVSRHIGNLFDLMFDRSHFSVRCVKTSLLITFLYFVIFGLQFIVTYFATLQEFPVWRSPTISTLPIHTAIVQDLWNAFPYIILISAIGDYISLGKGRLITYRLRAGVTFPSLVQWVFLDIILSLAMGLVIVVVVIMVAGYMGGPGPGFLKGLWVAIIGGRFIPAYEELVFIVLHGGSTSVGSIPADLMWVTLFISTLTTSIWTVGILIAASLVKCLNSLLAMTRWLFDVEKHPIRVIGRVLGPLMGISYLAVWLIWLH